MSPTARALSWLRRRNISVTKVERWIPHANVRADAFGFGDLLAFGRLPSWDNDGNEQEGVRDSIVLIQVTSGANHAARRAKIETNPDAIGWRKSGGRIWIMSWSKRGKSRKTWTPRVEEIA